MRFPNDEVLLRRGGAINAHRLEIYRRSLDQVRSYILRQPTSPGLLTAAADVHVLCQQVQGNPRCQPRFLSAAPTPGPTGTMGTDRCPTRAGTHSAPRSS